MVRAGVFLGDPVDGEGGLEVVAAAAVAGEAGGVDEGVVGQDRGGIAVLSCGVEEGGDDDRAGDVTVGGDRGA